MMHKGTRTYVACALFAALICVSTIVLPIPIPGNGYLNIGDAFVLAAAWLLGPVFGAIAAGVGSGLSDLILGYTIYIPATTIIKAIVAIIAYYLFVLISKRSNPKTKFGFRLAAAISAELVMVVGYFVYETFLFGSATAAVAVLFNGIQALFGAVAGTLLFTVLDRYGIAKKLLKE